MVIVRGDDITASEKNFFCQLVIFCLYIEENKKRSFGLKAVFFLVVDIIYLCFFLFVFVKSGMEFGVHFFVGCFLSVIISFYGWGDRFENGFF